MPEGAGPAPAQHRKARQADPDFIFKAAQAASTQDRTLAISYAATRHGPLRP